MDLLKENRHLVTDIDKAKRFQRVFPSRALSLKKGFQLVENTTKKNGYEWGWCNDHVRGIILELAKMLEKLAHKFDLDFHITLDGENVQEINLEDFLPLEVVERNSKEN